MPIAQSMPNSPVDVVDLAIIKWNFGTVSYSGLPMLSSL